MRKVVNNIDNNIYKRIGKYRLNQMQFLLISFVNILLFTVGLDIGLSLISFGGLPGGDIAGGTSIIVQSILIAFRMNHANKSPSVAIVIYIIAFIIVPQRSFIILLIVACIPKGIQSNENNITPNETINNTNNTIINNSIPNISNGVLEGNNNITTSTITNNSFVALQAEKLVNHDQQDFLKDMLVSSLGGISLLGLLLTVGYFILGLFLERNILSITVITLSYIIVIFTTKKCIRAINIRAQGCGEGENPGSNQFIIFVIVPLLLEIIGYVLFWQFLYSKELWIYTIVCAASVFVIFIIHYLLFRGRIGNRGTRLALKQKETNNPEGEQGKIYNVIKRRIIRWNVITPILMGAVIIGLPLAFSTYCNNASGCNFPWRLERINFFQ